MVGAEHPPYALGPLRAHARGGWGDAPRTRAIWPTAGEGKRFLTPFSRDYCGRGFVPCRAKDAHARRRTKNTMRAR